MKSITNLINAEEFRNFTYLFVYAERVDRKQLKFNVIRLCLPKLGLESKS